MARGTCARGRPSPVRYAVMLATRMIRVCTRAYTLSSTRILSHECVGVRHAHIRVPSRLYGIPNYLFPNYLFP